MGYNNFAYHYDAMMSDVDYDWWLNIIQTHIPENAQILDVGCGTGTLSLQLATAGYHVTGLDLSEDMLVVATEKAKTTDVDVTFIQKDMREIGELSGYDAILAAVDTVNYLTCENDVKKMFQGAKLALNSGGIFIFDVHTTAKINDIFDDYLYVENTDALTYIWHVAHGEKPLSIIHELTLFAQNENGTYHKSVEHHHQQTYERHQYTAWLDETGFDILATYEEDMSRILFVAKIKDN